ncbi:hypothetical protein FSP39_011120 [Pinctada imbricata]|uniref:TIR domain-containing protein n=1 Tax=Pinctada imbricata TaxID=66713 RepID=A0AA88Y901_PINIB|nr:hypothetical protein FSP39_011120 [Pinctada imbricata]
MAASKHGAAAVLVILFLAIMRAHGNDSHAINCMKKWRKDGIYINCSARNLTVVPDFTHRSFITQLDLSSNNISVLSNTPFKDMKNMTHLDLSKNRLVCLPVDVFKGLQSLKYLSLYANNIPLNNHSYPDGLFHGLKRLKFLDLRRNDPCTDLKNGAYPSTALVDLKSLEELHIDALYHTSFDYLFRKMKSLSKLIMTSPGINCFLGNISVDYFQNLPYLSFVDVSSCGIKSVEKGLFQSLRSLDYLDVSGNQWLTFKSLYNLTYGMHKTNIQVLKMKNIHCTGGIGTYLRTCQMTNLFKTRLRELYLDQNRIEIIEKGLLPQLPQSLKHLSIAQNKLTMGLYMFDFSNLANLEVVNSSLLLVPPNPVNVIVQDCKEDLDTPACPKVTTNYQNYMQKEDSNKAAEISQKEKVRIAFEINGSADDNVDDLYGFAVPILLPPKLRVLYYNNSRLYWSVKSALISRNNLEEFGYVKLEQHNFDYDAFISYAADDRWFVVDGIMPILEKEKGLRFILHDRDFLPGNDISDNIMAAIRNSRKTVCVLSKNFFKSYWCTFEFNMACMENFNARKGEKIIFLILLEDIRDEDLQPKMLEYMEDKSYIKVPTDGDNNAVFWNNIYKALID